MRSNRCKAILENILEPCVLGVLCKQSNYGYALQHELEAHLQNTINAGNLYRILGRLHRSGYVSVEDCESCKGPKKKMYSLTLQGRKYLKEWHSELENHRVVLSKVQKILNSDNKELQRK